jgi:hypothetical protein
MEELFKKNEAYIATQCTVIELPAGLQAILKESGRIDDSTTSVNALLSDVVMQIYESSLSHTDNIDDDELYELGCILVKNGYNWEYNKNSLDNGIILYWNNGEPGSGTVYKINDFK